MTVSESFNPLIVWLIIGKASPYVSSVLSDVTVTARFALLIVIVPTVVSFIS